MRFSRLITGAFPSFLFVNNVTAIQVLISCQWAMAQTGTLSFHKNEWRVRWCDQIIRCMCNLPIKKDVFLYCGFGCDHFFFLSLLSPRSLVKPKWRLMPCFKTHCVYSLPIKNINSFSTCIDIIPERLCKMV